MDQMTALEMHDVNDRQGLTGLACCSRPEPMSGLAGYFSDAWDCLLSPVECTKAAFGTPEASAEAWQKMKQPDAPARPAPKPQPRPTQEFIGPACPPQLRSDCQAPAKFDPYTCACDISKSGPGGTSSPGCQPPDVFDPVNKVCHRNSGVAVGLPWYKQPPIMIALGLGVVALALSMKAKP